MKEETQANLCFYLPLSISKRSLNPEVLNVYCSKDQDIKVNGYLLICELIKKQELKKNKVNGFSNLFQLVI